MSLVQPFLGLFIFITIPYLISRDRKKISYKFVGIGLIFQFILALVFLKIPPITNILLGLNNGVGILQASTDKAAQFMFGYIAGGPPPFQISSSENMFIVAFRVLPLILVINALSSLLFHFGVLSFIIKSFSRILQRFFKISGTLGFGAAATVFLGTIEAPLIIKPYLPRLTKPELLALITCSMSTVAGTVMVLYASVLEEVLPNALTHLLTASIISVPSALLLSHVFLPTDQSHDNNFVLEKSNLTWIEALLISIQDGLQMIMSIVAIIIVLFAFTYLIDATLVLLHPNLSLSIIVSQLLRPIVWLVGIDWDKSLIASELMGTKIILNEFVSFLKLSQLTIFNSREILALVYSLCGFANLASAGIIIAGLTTVLPQRRAEIVQLTFVSLLLGNLATLMTGCVINIMTHFF